MGDASEKAAYQVRLLNVESLSSVLVLLLLLLSLLINDDYDDEDNCKAYSVSVTMMIRVL